MARFPFSFSAGGPAAGGGAQPEISAAARRQRLSAAVRVVARRLGALRLPGEAASYRDQRPVLDASGRVSRWRGVEVGPGLYGGLAGIALFLAQRAECLERGSPDGLRDGLEPAGAARTEAFQAWRRLSREVSAELEAAGEAGEGAGRLPRTIGAYTGWGGLVYAATYLGRLWRREELLDRAELWTGRIAAQLEGEPFHDLLSGSAGALLAVLRLFALRPSSDLRKLALACGERLLETAVEQDDGSLGWENGRGGVGRPGSAGYLGTGLAHGPSGIAWALAELSARSGEGRFLTAARRALAFERAELLGRLEGQAGLSGHSWCHGLPGMGIARLAVERSALGHADGEPPPGASEAAEDAGPRGRCREEVAAAVAFTLRAGRTGSHCLCHGDLGDLDFLLLADRLGVREMLPLGRDALRREVSRRGARVAREVCRDGPLCGLLSANGERPVVPGLMGGLAGIGYGLLRLADPVEVPSVLMLELPARPGRAGRRGISVDLG